MVKENNTVQNNSSQAPTSVSSALPQETKSSGDSKVSSTDNSKREELTNYELSSKTVTTTSGGYTIDHMSIAILVNRAALQATPIRPRCPPSSPTSRGLVTSASGLRKERGDTIKVLAESTSPTPGTTSIRCRRRRSSTC